jgi:hypothetical protein
VADTLGELLEPAGSELLHAMHGNFKHPAFAALLGSIQATVDEEAHISSAAFINKIQQCFAVKPAKDSFLCLARQSFSEITESIHQLADSYKEEFDLPNLKVCMAVNTASHFGHAALHGSGIQMGTNETMAWWIVLQPVEQQLTKGSGPHVCHQRCQCS